MPKYKIEMVIEDHEEDSCYTEDALEEDLYKAIDNLNVEVNITMCKQIN